MSGDKTNDLIILGQNVEALIQQMALLKEENRLLRLEINELKENNKLALKKIENIINKIKVFENLN
jgi:regulator of replication initiation timing